MHSEAEDKDTLLIQYRTNTEFCLGKIICNLLKVIRIFETHMIPLSTWLWTYTNTLFHPNSISSGLLHDPTQRFAALFALKLHDIEPYEQRA